MSRIVAAKAYANNEAAFLAWMLDATIADCLGFEITRIYTKTNDERVLAAWAPFKRQSNPDWEPQTTSVWPVQKLVWRDLTLRRRRDQTSLRPDNVAVKYRIRPSVKASSGLHPVTNLSKKTYQGHPLPLAYADEGFLTNEVVVTSAYGSVQAAFTNGILSAQWLRHALEEQAKSLTVDVVRKHIQTPGDKIRTYLTGDVLSMLTELLERAAKEKAKVLLALYELRDKELLDALLNHRRHIRVILSNSSKPRGSDEWDFGNKEARKKLKRADVEVYDRMFNNNHIGHNKFAVLVGAGNKPKAVMTGSTNWTSTGLCSQTNNVFIIESPEVARDYLEYWNRLLEDTENFETPKSLSARASNAQGAVIRTANADSSGTSVLKDGTKITAWFAPNTAAKTKKEDSPPDMATVFSLMRKAKKAILFACFLPSRSGLLSIIKEAIDIGIKDPSLLVYGAISDPTAMPSYVPPDKRSDEEGEGEGDDRPKKPQPATFDKGRIHVVRAASLTKNDIVADFETELLKAGNAIIHDKIIVVDPLSDDDVVVAGSHNLGYKASYENDENFAIIQGNSKLIEAYAVHVLDIYDYYRFRAVQEELRRQDKKSWGWFPLSRQQMARRLLDLGPERASALFFWLRG